MTLLGDCVTDEVIQTKTDIKKIVSTHNHD